MLPGRPQVYFVLKHYKKSTLNMVSCGQVPMCSTFPSSYGEFVLVLESYYWAQSNVSVQDMAQNDSPKQALYVL